MPLIVAALLPLSLLVGGPLRPAALPASPVAREALHELRVGLKELYMETCIPY